MEIGEQITFLFDGEMVTGTIVNIDYGIVEIETEDTHIVITEEELEEQKKERKKRKRGRKENE